jgi:bifunctional non-homologous end joining protein LigD
MPGADKLREYKAKRDFKRTKEPSGGRSRRRTGDDAGRFVVQMHDATRLHYDFRLEMDGVLKSWAVTRGPSNNPADKRLAVRVEDHPLDYASFEGAIPEGEYGGGTVMLWDEGTWEPIGDPHEGLESGDLKLRLHGQRMQGEWVLVHMKGRDTKTRKGNRENWLLIKHRDEHATDSDTLIDTHKTSVSTGRDLAAIAAGAPAKTRQRSTEKTRAVWTGGKSVALPAFRPPQLATLATEVPTGNDWLFEVKYDGYRCLAAIAGKQVQLFTRNGLDWTEQFGPLEAPLAALTKGTALIDGEICALRDGHADFSALKQALSDGGDLVFFAFDLLEQDGEVLEKLPLLERKARLKKLLGKIGGKDPIQYSDHVRGHGDKVLAALCSAGQEGVIAKRADGPYRHTRSRDWLKVKCTRRQEFVIGGWRHSEKKSTFASLLLGTFEDGKLVYRGRVGTGWNSDSAAALQEQLDRLARKTSPFASVPREVQGDASWVKPSLVAEIDFAEFTPDGHLRHPSFVGLREDKPANDVVLETQPANLTEQTMTLTDSQGLAVAKRLGVALSNPEREAMVGEAISKAQLVAYYEAVSKRLLPHLVQRPLSLVRVPHGGRSFYQKHAGDGFPDELGRVPITEKEGDVEDYLYVTDLAGVAAAVQMNTLEFHIWGSRVDHLEQPDRLVFDIDPDEGLDFGAVRDAALTIRDRLAALKLKSYPMVSGGKGIHVVVPLQPAAEWDEAKTFCRAFAQQLETDEPKRFTANIRKAERKGRMFVDYLRNERGSTAITPFSTRARKGLPCAVPVGWDEVPDLKAANGFGIEAAAERAKGPDPWSGYTRVKQKLTPALLKRLGGGG